MKPGTKIALGCCAAFFVLLGAVALFDGLQQRALLELRPPAQVRPECQVVDQPAAYRWKKNANNYSFTITQPYRYRNPTDDYVEVWIYCEILRGPSREAENRVVSTTFTVSPHSPWRQRNAEFIWTDALKQKSAQEYLYDCTCRTKTVERPVRRILVSFVPIGF